MKQLTVFTPTYNRAYILPKVYQSLKNQTNQNFKWLIIDDGSSDNTSEIVKQWQEEKILDIEYAYQENKGMVGAHNTAQYLIKTELNVCIDSDDHMPVNAVELILDTWNKLPNKNKYKGLVGLDSYKNGKIIGDKFPEGLNECTFSEIRQKYKLEGDKKYVMRSDLLKPLLPYPEFPGEKFPATSYLYLFIEQKYPFYIINKPLCIVEYLPDGNSMNKIKAYRKSPNAFAKYRIAQMKYALSYKFRFKSAIHYVSSSIFAKNKHFIKESPYKLTTIAALPFGVVLYLILRSTKKEAVTKTLNKK